LFEVHPISQEYYILEDSDRTLAIFTPPYIDARPEKHSLQSSCVSNIINLQLAVGTDNEQMQ
jgi:hypothetical protein